MLQASSGYLGDHVSWFPLFFSILPPLNTRESGGKCKSFPPSDRLICRDTDWCSQGQRQGWNWSQGTFHNNPYGNQVRGSTSHHLRHTHTKSAVPPSPAENHSKSWTMTPYYLKIKSLFRFFTHFITKNSTTVKKTSTGSKGTVTSWRQLSLSEEKRLNCRQEPQSYL